MDKHKHTSVAFGLHTEAYDADLMYVLITDIHLNPLQDYIALMLHQCA